MLSRYLLTPVRWARARSQGAVSLLAKILVVDVKATRRSDQFLQAAAFPGIDLLQRAECGHGRPVSAPDAFRVGAAERATVLLWKRFPAVLARAAALIQSKG
jgi:hypothetical protein